MRSFVPPDIYSTNLAQLKSSMPVKIAERIFAKKILWLIRTPTELIAKTHIAELKTKFQSHGLDLAELRAICYVLPEAFENDSDAAKAAWKSKLLERLRELVGKEEKGEKIRRNRCVIRQQLTNLVSSNSSHRSSTLSSKRLRGRGKHPLDGTV